MKRTTISGLIFALTLSAASAILVAEDKKANELLQSGLTKETVEGDLKGAIELYQKAVREAGANRALSAKAQLRLGAAYQKQGDEQARGVFERVARDYTDQVEAAAEARAHLAVLDRARPGVTTQQGNQVREFPLAGNDVLDLITILPGASRVARQITLFDRQGKVLGTVGDPSPAGAMTLSPDGKRVALVRDGAIHVLDVATKAITKITSGPGDTQPTWSADGNRIAFQSTRGPGLFMTSSNGTGKEELLYSPIASLSFRDFNLVSWSSDGRFLTYQQREAGSGFNVWVLPVTGDRKPIPILRTPANDMGLRISPDGRYMSYRSSESGRSEVYVRRFDLSANPEPPPNAEKWKISTEAGAANAGVRWRADGKEIYYISAAGGVMAVEVTTTPTFKAGTPKLLFQAPAAYQSATDNNPGYSDASADGKIFALSVPRGALPNGKADGEK